MRDFTAVILAAGVGSRLRPLTDSSPKCLVSLGRETLLGRMVRLLVEAGAREIVVATGYLEGAVRAALAGCAVPVRFAWCPEYATTQNVVSLHRALALVEADEVIKLDGDVVFEAEVIARLLGEPGDACAAVDDREVPPGEAMKVRTHRGLITRFGKGIAAPESAGESIGVERFRAKCLAALKVGVTCAISAGRTDVYYEDVYNDLLDAGLSMAPVSVADLRWNEVDDHDDLARARALFPGG